MRTALKIIAWTLMALVLAVAGTLICAVKLLSPDKLTPIVEHVANKYLAADISLGRVELAFRPAFPVLSVSVDSATVVSRAFSGLSPAEKAMLPEYADTLLRFDHFSGSIELHRFLSRGEIALRDVLLRGPEVNIVVASDSLYNYDLLAAAPEDSTETASEIPPFSINRFRIEDARAFRYFNAVDSTDATVLVLDDAGIDGSEAPQYSISVQGNVDSPLIRTIANLPRVSFGASGRVRWDPSVPDMVVLDKFSLRGAFFMARMDAKMEFGNNLTIHNARFDLSPVRIDSLLTLVPEDVRRKWRLRSPYFSTDATLGLSGELTRPFVATTDTIPYAEVNLLISDSPLEWGRARFENLGLDLGMNLRGNCLDSATVELRRFIAKGPATRIEAKGSFKELIADPVFDACIKIDTRLDRLPSIVADLAGGFISGRLDADIDMSGKVSMFDVRNFHLLDIRGHVDGRDLYYLRNDTNFMAEVANAALRFGTDLRFRKPSGEKGNRMMAASVKIDTVSMLSGGIDMGLSEIMLGLGVTNDGTLGGGDTTIVVPMGGAVKVGRFNLRNITDSAGMNMRGLKGHMGIRRYMDSKRHPQFDFDLMAERIVAGAPAARVMLREPHILVEAHKMLTPRISKRVKRLADSIATAHPDLPPDSVYRLALEKRRHRPGQKVHHRVHTELTPEETQLLDWGTTSALRKLLLDWDIRGSVKTTRGRLFTPMFPLRNRISNVDIAFNTDSVILTNIRYRGGHSDLTINGIISNLRRGFTSSGFRSPLRANLEISSRKIDVNELAAATFAGAAYADKVRKGHAKGLSADDFDGDEDLLERRVAENSDTTAAGPLLIPTNIDARVSITADSILYSDLNMHGLTASLLMYDGAISLNDLKCTSEIGSLSLDALYNAPGPKDMKVGFGLVADRFIIRRFLQLVPAIDSIMPLMRDFGGIITADVAATCDVDTAMNLVLPTLDAAVRLQGDSLTFIDSKSYRTLGKWLGFKNKDSNIVKHLNVELTVRDNILRLYPFVLDIDRYRLGVQGYNDLALNFDYHIAVLKSPIPFKFGITVKGDPEKYKVRFGGSKFKADAPAASVAIVDTARVSLVNQFREIFRRGVSRSRFAKINTDMARFTPLDDALATDTLSRADSLALVSEGILPSLVNPDVVDNGAASPASEAKTNTPKKKGKSSKSRPQKDQGVLPKEQ